MDLFVCLQEKEELIPRVQIEWSWCKEASVRGVEAVGSAVNFYSAVQAWLSAHTMEGALNAMALVGLSNSKC